MTKQPERSVEEIEKDIQEICNEVECEYEMGGLSDGLYGSYAIDVAKRYAEKVLQAERQKQEEMVEEALYEVDVEKVPTIQDEAWANQFDSKAQAFWYGEAKAIENIREALTHPTPLTNDKD